MLNSKEIKVETTGGVGVSAGSARVQFSGKIKSIILLPQATAPATMDTVVTITQRGLSTTDIETVATFTDTNTIATAYPKKQAKDGSGTDVPAGDNAWSDFVTTTGVEVTVAQSNDLDPSVIVEVIYED